MTQNDRFLNSSDFIFKKNHVHKSIDIFVRLRLICILIGINLKLNKIYYFEVEFWKVRKITWHTDLITYLSENLVLNSFCVYMLKILFSVEAIILFFLWIKIKHKLIHIANIGAITNNVWIPKWYYGTYVHKPNRHTSICQPTCRQSL